MSISFHLRKGTRVSHGTALTNLLSIQSLGLLPSQSRHSLRDLTEELPKASAVYVGGPGAFFGAWAASGALFKEYSIAEQQLPTLGSIAATNPSELLNMVFAPPPLAIPTVLTIELQEDTLFVGDEDFALWREEPNGQLIRWEADTDESIWTRFRSGGLMRDGGIPPSWIKSMQFPQLLQTTNSTKSQLQRLGGDCELLAAGISQNHNRLTIDKVMLPKGPWTEASAFSQVRPFNQQSVEEVLSMRHLVEPANRLYNCLMQYNFVSAIGTSEYGISFVG